MVRVIAHRGASATHPENTLEAFRAARDQGAGGIELDVRLSADGVLVVHHDAHLADGTLLRGLNAEQMPDWIPTLYEALEVAGDMWVNVEIKNVPDEPDYDDEHHISVAVAGLVAATLAGDGSAISGDTVSGDTADGDRIIVSSFNVASVERIRTMDAGIHPHDILVDNNFVRRAHDAGLQVNVWTVDDPKRMVELAEFGVDGIITNAPDVAVEALS